ncbi:hypothetical protein [Actinomadura welshii]|uniref:hypothetical protein n=1 Tax=Actinomadura welshii TaxID=3103817 RepID=UPI001F327FD3|nr:hypothetical protein [Actinomadura madurae]
MEKSRTILEPWAADPFTVQFVAPTTAFPPLAIDLIRSLTRASSALYATTSASGCWYS